MKKGIFMDHSSTTPVDPLVIEAMLPYFSEKFGNASTLHEYGREARDGIDNAREQVAKALGAEAKDIIFTSGGTESDNLGIKGVAYKREEKGGHIITTSIEHQAVMNSCDHLETEGFEITNLPVNEYGQVLPEDL